MQLTRKQLDMLVQSVTMPNLRSCLQRTLDSMETDPEAECSHKITALSLIGFFRKNMIVTELIDEHNPLRTKLEETSTLYFGPMFLPTQPGTQTSRARRLKTLQESGYAVEHLAFLNADQVELFFSYVRETGLVRAN